MAQIISAVKTFGDNGDRIGKLFTLSEQSGKSISGDIFTVCIIIILLILILRQYRAELVPSDLGYLKETPQFLPTRSLKTDSFNAVKLNKPKNLQNVHI